MHYLNRILQVEKGTIFSPCFNNNWWNGHRGYTVPEEGSHVINNISTRMSFEILTSVLVARGKIRQAKGNPAAYAVFLW